MGRPCETPGCGNMARVGTSEDGWRCDGCREKTRAAARAEDCYRRCVHFVPETDTWMARFGSAEGRQRWIDDQWRYHQTARMDRPPWTRQRPEAEARRAAGRAYARLRSQAARNASWSWRCSRGHDCGATARIVGTDLLGGAIRDHIGEVVCDRQETCKDYVATGDVVARSGGMPQ